MPIIEFPNVEGFNLSGKFEGPIFLHFGDGALKESAGLLHDVILGDSLEFGRGSSVRRGFES